MFKRTPALSVILLALFITYAIADEKEFAIDRKIAEDYARALLSDPSQTPSISNQKSSQIDTIQPFSNEEAISKHEKNFSADAIGNLDSGGIEARAIEFSNSSKASEAVRDGTKRDPYVITPKDPILISSEEIHKDKEKFIQGKCEAKNAGNDDLNIPTETYTVPVETIETEAVSYMQDVEDERIVYDRESCEDQKTIIRTCQRILTPRCKQNHECNNGGIVPGSVVADMKYEYNYPILTIGTIADNYWGGYCQTYDRATTFSVKNVKAISEFRLIEVGFDDYILLILNGHTIYVGPHGGSTVEVRQTQQVNKMPYSYVFNGVSQSSCELSTNWVKHENIDLRNFLKEGENTLFMRVIVSGLGEGWIKIAARQHCCSDWEHVWTENCQASSS